MLEMKWHCDACNSENVCDVSSETHFFALILRARKDHEYIRPSCAWDPTKIHGWLFHPSDSDDCDNFGLRFDLLSAHARSESPQMLRAELPRLGKGRRFSRRPRSSIVDKSPSLTMSAVSRIFWSALLHALHRMRHFALTEICLTKPRPACNR